MTAVWLLTSKYVDHLPLYRLEQIAARDNVTLARSTLAEWVDRVGVALQPLVDRLTWHLLQGNTLHADETPESHGLEALQRIGQLYTIEGGRQTADH